MNDWEVKMISLSDIDCFQDLNGLWTGKKPPFIKAGVIRNTNFTKYGKIDYTDVAWLEVEEKQFVKRKLIQGDIIIERSGGGPKQPVGRVVYFENDQEPFSFSNFTSTIRVSNKAEFDAKFIFYCLLELYLTGKTEDIQRHTTGIRNLDFTAYKERAHFPKISLSEQYKIITVLSTVQNAIETQAKLITRTTELKKAMMHKLFTKGTRGEKQKMTEIGLVPEGWEVVEIESPGDISYGIQAAVANNLIPIGHVILTNKNITLDGRIVLDKVNYYKLKSKRDFNSILKSGDLLFNWRSGSKEHVGKTAFFDLTGEYTHSSFILRIRVNENNNARFLYYYLNYLRKIGYYIKVQTYSINAKFNKSAVNSMKIAVLLKKEQDNIVDILNPIDQKISLHTTKKQKLEDLFRTLLHQLMTAEVQVDRVNFGNQEAIE